MTKSPRTDVLVFNTGSFIPDANEHFVSYAERPIDGEIKKIVYKVGTWAQGGSLAIEVSGTGERIFYMNNVLNADQIKYPFVAGVSSINGAGSPQVFFRPVVCNHDGLLKVWGSGVGPIGSVCNGLNIYYGG